MTLQWLLGWWNLLFLLPVLLALLYIMLYVISGVGAGDTDADVSADADVDADVSVDAHAEADLGVDADSGVAADAHVDLPGDADVATEIESPVDADGPADAHHAHGHAPHGGGLTGALTALLGLGKAPLSLIVITLLMSWGFAGFFANVVLFINQEPAGSRFLLSSVLIAGICAIALTRLLASFMGRYMPMQETYAVRRHQLVGCTGEALYNIDAAFGLVSVRAPNRDLFQVPCRTRTDATPIPKGARVKLVAWNGRQQVYYVKLD